MAKWKKNNTLYSNMLPELKVWKRFIDDDLIILKGNKNTYENFSRERKPVWDAVFKN